MSKTINRQKEAESQLSQRKPKVEEPALEINQSEKSEGPQEAVQESQNTVQDIQDEGSSRNKAKHLFNLILSIFILSSVGLNIGLFLMSKKYSFVQAAMINDIENIKKALQSNESRAGDLSVKIKRLTTDFQGFNLKLAELRAGMREIIGNSEAHKASIENLAKVKDALSGRISDIETELKKLKGAAQSSAP